MCTTQSLTGKMLRMLQRRGARIVDLNSSDEDNALAAVHETWHQKGM